MQLKNVPRLGLRRIAEEWSWEPGTQSNTEILTRLLSAFWRREYVGHDAPDPQVTLTVLKRMGAFPREYWDEENPPTDEFEFLASIPPDGYDETAPECYGTVAWSILDGVELPAEVLAGWCDAHDILTDIPHIPSKFVEIVPLSHRQGNCIPYAAIRWHDFGNRPALGRPLGHFSRHPDTPLLSLSPRRRFPRPTPERVFVADHQSSSGFSGTGPSAPPPQPIGT